MATVTVATPCAAYNRMALDWDIVDALMGGTRTMTEKGSLYLPKNPAETQAQFDARMGRTYLKPALRNAIHSGKGAVFRYNVDISEVSPKLQPLMDDIDLQGNDITSFLAGAFGDMLTYGHCHLLAAYPTMNPNATLADANDVLARPYGVRIAPRNVISWAKSTARDYETLAEVRFRESAPSDGRPEWDVDSETMHIVVLRPGEWQDWQSGTNLQPVATGGVLQRDPGAQTGWARVASGTISLPDIPWTTIYADRVDFMVSRPPFMDLAWLNIAHWQSYSDYRNILHVAQVPHMFGSGMSPTDTIITVGMSSATIAENPSADLRYVEHSGKAIESGRQELLDLEAAMEKLGAALLSEDETGTQTATGEAIDTAQEQATLGGIVRSLQDGANLFLWHMGQWLATGDDVGKITIRRPVAMGGRENVVPGGGDGEEPQQIIRQAAE